MVMILTALLKKIW